MLLWFVTIAALGVRAIVADARGARARSTRGTAVQFFARARTRRASSRSARSSSCVTGGEALYADMGHFGKRPIRIAWFAVVLPALLLNYFGQGALLLREPSAASNPFYLLAPPAFQWPLLVIATAGGDRRVAGAHLRRVLAHAAERAARLLAAHADHPHLASTRRDRSTSPR